MLLKIGFWQRVLVVSSLTATEETEAMGPEIESRQDTHRVVVSKQFLVANQMLTVDRFQML
jgi:hypothetical protein